MTNKNLLALAMAGTLALPLAAQAQGTVRGAAEGAAVGVDAAGPIGGIVVGAVGAATGTVRGILGLHHRPRFRSYIRSDDYDGRVAVGSTLPSSGVTYYDVPDQYRVKPGYRYTVVNDRPLLVERSHRIVEVID